MQYAPTCGNETRGFRILRHLCIARWHDVGAVREPPLYRDMEVRTHITTQRADFVLVGDLVPTGEGFKGGLDL